jgi:hypothetical protein
MRGNACDMRREVSARKVCMTHPRDDEREKEKKKERKKWQYRRPKKGALRFIEPTSE